MDIKKLCIGVACATLCAGCLAAFIIRQERLIALEEAEREALTDALADALAEEMSADEVAL